MNRELIELHGDRMRIAREMSNLTQIKASKLLGFANGSRIAKIEHGKVKGIVLVTAIRASEIYDISLDYLFGISDLYYKDAIKRNEQKIKCWLHDDFEKARIKNLAMIMDVANKTDLIENYLSLMINNSSELKQAFDKFILKNDGFMDMPCGGALDRLINDYYIMASNAKNLLKKSNTEIHQLSLL